MKKMILTAFLGLVGASYAQSTSMPSLSPVYQKFALALADTRPDWKQVNEFITRNVNDAAKGEKAIDRASGAYLCSVFLKKIIETSSPKDIADKKIETNSFKGNYTQTQKYCDDKFAENYNNLPEARFVPEEVAYIASNYLIIADDRYPKVDEGMTRFKNHLDQNRYFDTKLFYNTVAVDLYLTKYPELKEQNFQRGSVVVGKGSETLKNSLQLLSQEADFIADYNKKKNQAAQAETNAAQQKTLTDLKNLYVKVTGWQAAAEQLTKQKKFEDATQAYFLISTQDQALKFITDELKQQNNNSLIDVNGKKIATSDAVTTLDKIISTSLQKANSVDTARQQTQQALAAQWKQAAKNTLKGDRLTIFNRFGIPNVLLPGDMYTGDADIKRSMTNIQKATGWKYSFNQTAYGGFFCNINVTFNGNKATSRSISASIVGSEPDAYCKSQYRF